MLSIGKFNSLTITQCLGDIYLDASPFGIIILPRREAPAHYQIGDQLSVFVYSGSKGQLAATTQKPFAEVDEIAWLKVVAVNRTGAFLDWGLSKNLLLPFSEQRQPVLVGQHYLVKIFLDHQQRLAATTKFERLIIDEAYYFKVGQSVTALIAERTELGFKAIVNHSHWGMLYHNELLTQLKKGQTVTAYIKYIRPDRKIDLSLQALGHAKIDQISNNILLALKANQGQLALGDKSSPETIYATFSISKKAFKQAIGGLFKQKLIDLNDHNIRLR